MSICEVLSPVCLFSWCWGLSPRLCAWLSAVPLSSTPVPYVHYLLFNKEYHEKEGNKLPLFPNHPILGHYPYFVGKCSFIEWATSPWFLQDLEDSSGMALSRELFLTTTTPNSPRASLHSVYSTTLKSLDYCPIPYRLDAL